MTAPLVQLYCKRLTIENLDGFLGADPDHIGWQINFSKLQGDDRSRAIDASAQIAQRVRQDGKISVFLIHPSTDAVEILSALQIIQPDIFLCSAARDDETLRALMRAGVDLMVPVGIPSTGALAGYDPHAITASLKGLAGWMTTDTITPADNPEAFGCSGKTSDWSMMSAVINAAPIPVVAAGGLTPDNVADLWALCRPAGMDAHTSVCTGGLPDLDKSRRFVAAVRALS